MVQELENKYFEWLVDIVCNGRFAKSISYRKLLTQLHMREFIYSIPMDANRADDGLNMRWRFVSRMGYPEGSECDITGPCSVLEMMIALAIRCEENIMDDPLYGDRTGQWFWGMINNLGLGSMLDDNFDKGFVNACIDRLLDRNYSSNGKGGLFTIKNCDLDLREVEIWIQLCRYLDSMIGY